MSYKPAYIPKRRTQGIEEAAHIALVRHPTYAHEDTCDGACRGIERDILNLLKEKV